MASFKRQSRKRASILAKDFDLDLSELDIDDFAEDNHDKKEDRNDTDHQSNEEEEEEDDDDEDKYAKYERQLKDRADLNASNSSFTKRALNSFRQTAAVSLKSSRVDAVLASFGCAGSLALLQFLSDSTPREYEFMGSFLVGSSLKFFYNENPPSLRPFVESSLFAIAAGQTLHFVPHFCGEYARTVLLFATILYWKLYGGMWTAANTLSMIVAVESGGWSTAVRGMKELNKWANSHEDDDPATINDAHFPWRYLFFPYISGHLILYGMACLMSILRRKVRTYLIQREFVSKQMGWEATIVGGRERRNRLRKLFNRMDTSGDGQLDVIELQVALRAATGTDISLADTKEILQSVDSDGNGSLDFDEFCASIDKLWPE